MKKIYFLVFLLLLAVGCNKDNNRKVEVIKLNDNSYVPFTELDNYQELSGKLRKLKINEQISKKIAEQNIPGSGFEHYYFILFIDKEGKADKIVMLEGPESKASDILIKTFTNQTFVKGTKNGNPVNYRINWWYQGEYNVKADSMPEPIGGIEAIQKNIIYPEIARRAGIQGKVYVKAFITEDGNVEKAIIIKGIGGGCDQAAINAIKKVKFKPGMENGIPVKVQVSIPVIFRLSNK